jgi:hypothetical protein
MGDNVSDLTDEDIEWLFQEELDDWKDQLKGYGFAELPRMSMEVPYPDWKVTLIVERRWDDQTTRLSRLWD